mmetsp:Transcript_23122/g.41799  ORF Transcript_23122/g.41799 Transcript_23122/m.41799 type:complete len:473 (-) Transcript_23122:320-1738(-)
MTSAELETIKEQFKAWDSDGDGTISMDELKYVMGKLSPDMTEADLELLMKEIDDNGDGVIQFEEFVTWIADPGSSKAMDEQGNFSNFDFKGTLKPLFRIFDKDDGGSISKEEFVECHSMLVNSMKIHPDSSNEDSWGKVDFSSIDSDGSGEIDFDEFCGWMTNILKECGVPKTALPDLMTNIVEALRTIQEIDEAVAAGQSESRVNKALQESVEKVAANARALFTKKKASKDEAKSSWCPPPRGFSLQLLARKCAAELGLGLGGLEAEKEKKAKSKRVSRAASMTATGQVRLCIPDINGGKADPATKWFARVSRTNKEGNDEFFVYEFDATSGKLDWSRNENENAFNNALDALPKDLKVFCLLKTRGLMSESVRWPGIREALLEAADMSLMLESDLDKYGTTLCDMMLEKMQENDEIADIEDMGGDPVEVAMEKMEAEVSLSQLQVLVGLAELGLLDVSERSLEQIMDMPEE